MKYLVISLLIGLIGCASVQEQTIKTNPKKYVAASKEQETKKRIYYFQHKLLPKWLYTSDGKFYEDLIHENFKSIYAAAEDLVGYDYATKVKVSLLDDKKSILIEFPKPEDLPHCYFALITQTDGESMYYTYEKTITYDNDLAFGVMGGWDKKGSHLNFGLRAYQTAEGFVNDVIEAK